MGYPTMANARPVDPLVGAAIAAKIDNKLEDYAHRAIPAIVLRDGNTATLQRLAAGELNRLDPSKLEAWNGGSVEQIDGIKFDPLTIEAVPYMKAASVGALKGNRAQNANLIALNTYAIIQLLMAKREALLGSLLSTTSNWHSDSGALAAGSKWTASGGDPIKLLHEMLDAVGGRDIVMTRGAFNAFCKNSKVLSARPTTTDRSVLAGDEAMELVDSRLGGRLIVSRARFYNGTKHTPILSADFVWVGNLSEMPTQVGAAGNTFRVTQAGVVRAVEQLTPPPDSNRGRAGYVLGGADNGVYLHQFANNAAEATQVNLGFSEVLKVGLKNNGIVKTGVA